VLVFLAGNPSFLVSLQFSFSVYFLLVHGFINSKSGSSSLMLKKVGLGGAMLVAAGIGG
jgi:hypothetical protein